MSRKPDQPINPPSIQDQLRPGLRLLPWNSPDGKPCYVSPAPDGCDGFVSDMADNVEAIQLRIGEELLLHTRKMLDDPCVPHREFRYASVRLSEALRDAVRIAHSRGARLEQGHPNT
ncbi:hypothetical protein ACQUSR_20155 [Streptomyces sp. P1-3]|uniref:hypothetical protein n=1 Tax=Streptomyces sp. P1-3 TaxID=3421658 RepID=UPI003D35F912